VIARFCFDTQPGLKLARLGSSKTLTFIATNVATLTTYRLDQATTARTRRPDTTGQQTLDDPRRRAGGVSGGCPTQSAVWDRGRPRLWTNAGFLSLAADIVVS